MTEYRLVTAHCSRCGKEFLPTPDWVYKRDNKRFCSFHCSNEDFKEAEEHRKKREEAARERKKRRESERKERKTEVKPNNYRPVLQYTTDGVLVARHESVKAAAEAVGKSTTSISQCAHGFCHTIGGYMWRFERSRKND